MSDMNQKIIEEFRTNDGKVGGFFADRTLLLLQTAGAKSGKERVNPLATFEDGYRLVVVASKGGESLDKLLVILTEKAHKDNLKAAEKEQKIKDDNWGIKN